MSRILSRFYQNCNIELSKTPSKLIVSRILHRRTRYTLVSLYPQRARVESFRKLTLRISNARNTGGRRFIRIFCEHLYVNEIVFCGAVVVLFNGEHELFEEKTIDRKFIWRLCEAQAPNSRDFQSRYRATLSHCG